MSIRKIKLENVPTSRFATTFLATEALNIIDGVIQVSRDADVFYLLLYYLSSDFDWEMIDDEELDRKVRDEIDYWNIPMPPTRIILQLQAIFDSEPSKAHYKTIDKFRQLRPLDILAKCRDQTFQYNNKL